MSLGAVARADPLPSARVKVTEIEEIEAVGVRVRGEGLETFYAVVSAKPRTFSAALRLAVSQPIPMRDRACNRALRVAIKRVYL